MLNRRILRVKAFQNLYAYEQCKASNFNLAKDQIKEAQSFYDKGKIEESLTILKKITGFTPKIFKDFEIKKNKLLLKIPAFSVIVLEGK